jgi:hypothetical protein
MTILNTRMNLPLTTAVSHPSSATFFSVDRTNSTSMISKEYQSRCRWLIGHQQLPLSCALLKFAVELSLLKEVPYDSRLSDE